MSHNDPRWAIVDKRRRCSFLSCVEPQEDGRRSVYCRYHVNEIENHIKSKMVVIREQPVKLYSGKMEVNEDTWSQLRELKSLHMSPTDTWIMDFEFVSMYAKISPIPLQLSIRDLHGTPILETNIDYGITLETFRDLISDLETISKGMAASTFLRCYGEFKTNGMTPERVRDYILNHAWYDREKIQLLSWSSQQDMQCLRRLMEGDNEVIQPKFSHHTEKNFQKIDVSILCQKLYPQLPNRQLKTVHQFLISQKHPVEYHMATSDTQAMIEIIGSLMESFEEELETI
jgi:hypothetical protein